MEYNRKIVLENGEVYYGRAFGSREERICELVFNTSMTGYQEILSDLSYTDQAVVMTYPLIGNYGMAAEDYEASALSMGALIVREYNDSPSNFRSTASLGEIMERHGIPGVCGVDTRKLARSIRDYGSRKALITECSMPVEEAISRLEAFSLPRDAVFRVSCRKPWVSEAVGEARFHVAAIDCGMKLNMVRSLNCRGCRVTVFPWNTAAGEIEDCCPDGILLSNGPGDPKDVKPVIETVKELRGKYPMFGICLGHQIISLAYGAETYKLEFGHRGGNHPVQNLENGRIEITSQNHSYAVDEASLPGTGLQVTHRNLLDQTVEGAACKSDRVFSVQYHPESAPGPQDSGYLFDRFLNQMEEGKSHA